MERLWDRTHEFFLGLNFQHIKKFLMFYLLIMEGVGNRAFFLNHVEMEKITEKIMFKNARLLSHRLQQIVFMRILPKNA